MNKCVFVGNLTRDPESNTTANGISLCRFSIAVNRSFANANGEREADFINIVTWRGLADNCAKYLSKGKKVAVSGSLQTRSYEDKDGNKRTATEIVADDVEFLSARGSSDDAPPPAYSGSSYNNSNSQKSQKMSDLEPINSDDLPF